MAGHRKDLRAAVVAAVANDVRLGTATFRRAWAHNVNDGDLPSWTVRTATENASWQDKDTFIRRVSLSVLLKRVGNEEIEDEIDDDADAFEAVVLAVFESFPGVVGYDPPTFSASVNGEGAKRIGLLELTFTVQIETEIEAA